MCASRARFCERRASKEEIVDEEGLRHCWMHVVDKRAQWIAIYDEQDLMIVYAVRILQHMAAIILWV